MAEYINREIYCRQFCRWCKDRGNGTEIAMCPIWKAPTEQAVPVEQYNQVVRERDRAILLFREARKAATGEKNNHVVLTIPEDINIVI